MPPHNTPEERPSTPTQPYMSRQPTHPNTPASHWSSSAPSTPQYEPHHQQVPPQHLGHTVTIVPSSTLVRRRPLQPPRRELPQQSEVPRGTQVDLRSLDYISVVDENLICPICRIALINPITTSCDHVFCRDCFDQSHRISAACPIDRWPIVLPHDIGPTHRLILNQLDGLEVKCPNTTYGCEKILARSMVQNHVDKYCGHAMISCPEKACEGKVLRKDLSGGCLHYTSICPDCAESLLQVDMERHREKECSERKTSCEECGIEIIRCRANEHVNDCEEAVIPCKWNIYGCSYRSKRKELIDHAPACDFKVMGPVVETLKEEINALRSEIQFLNEKDKAKDRRIKFLESDRMASSSSNALGYPVPDISALPDTAPSSAEYAPFDSRDQYLLSLLESQESKVDQLSVGMTEIEAKQTMMLFNETIPIKEQLAELRSAQGVLGMHVRWLMNFRLQERRPGAAAGPSNEAKPGDGPGGPDFQTMRRSSDTMRELVTKL
jgi:TNF receptor-associated factor 5